MKSRSRNTSKSQPSRRTQEARYAKVNRGSDLTGIHNRRDKRFPMAKTGTSVEEPVALADGENPEHRVDPAHSPETSAWQEAVMLWLSWNSTYEKLTAKMCRAGTDQAKLEALMDEMDQLRTQAITLSEELIRAA